jgi:hypothetical protein
VRIQSSDPLILVPLLDFLLPATEKIVLLGEMAAHAAEASVVYHRFRALHTRGRRGPSSEAPASRGAKI